VFGEVGAGTHRHRPYKRMKQPWARGGYYSLSSFFENQTARPKWGRKKRMQIFSVKSIFVK